MVTGVGIICGRAKGVAAEAVARVTGVGRGGGGMSGGTVGDGMICSRDKGIAAEK